MTRLQEVKDVVHALNLSNHYEQELISTVDSTATKGIDEARTLVHRLLVIITSDDSSLSTCSDCSSGYYWVPWKRQDYLDSAPSA
jgi:hypothetical protein